MTTKESKVARKAYLLGMSEVANAFHTRAEVIETLKAEVAKSNQKTWAKAHRISPAYVNDVLNCRRAPGFIVLQALGFKALELYAKSDSGKGRSL